MLSTIFQRQNLALRIILLCSIPTISGLLPSPAAAQVAPDQAAEMLLTSARGAFNKKDYSFAALRFKDFIDKFGSHKEAPAARYGLALCLLEGPERDHQRALDNLQHLAGLKDFPDAPFVQYYLGVSQRGLGVRELAQAEQKPQEAPQRRAAANARFEEASKNFGAALAAFSDRVKDVPADVKELPVDLEWAARARCDQAEMQLRLLKWKDAATATEPFVKDGAR